VISVVAGIGFRHGDGAQVVPEQPRRPQDQPLLGPRRQLGLRHRGTRLLQQALFCPHIKICVIWSIVTTRLYVILMGVVSVVEHGALDRIRVGKCLCEEHLVGNFIQEVWILKQKVLAWAS